MVGAEMTSCADGPSSRRPVLRAAFAPPRGAWAIIFLVNLLGVAVSLHTWDLPNVRNGVVYARVAERLASGEYTTADIATNPRLNYGKPIGFAWLSSLTVGSLGAAGATRLASLMGMVLCSVAVLRLFESIGANSRGLRTALTLYSPIFIYQYWASYADGMFTALVLLAFAETHKIANSKSTLANTALLTLATAAAVMVRQYGVILIVVCPLYILVHRTIRVGGRRPEVGDCILPLLGLASVALFVALAVLDRNPLLSFAEARGTLGGGASIYGRISLSSGVAGGLSQVALTLFLNLNVTLLFLRPFGRRDRSLRCLFLLPTLYIVGLMPFPGTYYNMRYFLPVIPFVVAGMRLTHDGRAGSIAKKGALCTYIAINTLLISVFNAVPIAERSGPFVPAIGSARFGSVDMLDCLRLPQHLNVRRRLQSIVEHVTPGSKLYIVGLNYYDDAVHGFYERGGHLDPKIDIHYVEWREVKPAAGVFYVLVWRERTLSAETRLNGLGKWSRLDQGLYQIGPR